MLKVLKKKFINRLADEQVKHDEYLEVMDNIDKLKQELFQFLKFDELTSEILHRLINRIKVKKLAKQ